MAKSKHQTKKRQRVQRVITDVNLKVNLTEIEVEQIYNISRRQLRTMRMRGNGPVWVKISGQIGHSGGRILYPVESLKQWLAAQPRGGSAIAAA